MVDSCASNRQQTCYILSSRAVCHAAIACRPESPRNEVVPVHTRIYKQYVHEVSRLEDAPPNIIAIWLDVVAIRRVLFIRRAAWVSACQDHHIREQARCTDARKRAPLSASVPFCTNILYAIIFS